MLKFSWLLDVMLCIVFFVAEFTLAGDNQIGFAYAGISILFLARVLWGPR
jgi:hypothetical protein